MLSELLKKSLPIFDVNLPLNKKRYRFRPMTVKEEKYLLLAQNEGNTSSMAYAMKNILESCFENLSNAQDLELIDAQTAFLNLRTRSIGDAISFEMKCPETGEKISLSCTALDFKPNGKLETNHKIKLDNNIILVLRTPTLNYFIQKETDVKDDIKHLFINCFKEVHTEDNVINKSDTSTEDISEFYDSLTAKQYLDVMNFFENIPKLELEIEYTTTDKVKRKVKFSGLDSFFELASAI